MDRGKRKLQQGSELPKVLVIEEGEVLYSSLSRALGDEAHVMLSSSRSYDDFMIKNRNASAAPPDYVAIIISSASFSLNSVNCDLSRPPFVIHPGAVIDTCYIAVYAPEAAHEPLLRDMLFVDMNVNMVHT